jgi:hypothetical protein
LWLLPRAFALGASTVLLPSASSSKVSFATDLRLPRLGFLWDHVISGRSIMPAAGFLEADLDTLSIYGRALPAGEIAQHYSLSFPGS